MLLKMTKGAEIFIKMTDLLESFSKDFSDVKKEFEKKLKEIELLKEKLEVEQRLIAKLNLIEEADSVIKQYGLVESIGSKEDGIFYVMVDENFGYKVLGCRKRICLYFEFRIQFFLAVRKKLTCRIVFGVPLWGHLFFPLKGILKRSRSYETKKLKY